MYIQFQSQKQKKQKLTVKINNLKDDTILHA